MQWLIKSEGSFRVSGKHIAVLLFSVLVRVKNIFFKNAILVANTLQKNIAGLWHSTLKGSTQDLYMPMVEKEPQMSEAAKRQFYW